MIIAHRYVITCAHVLGRGPEQPTAPFSIDIPRAGHGRKFTAHVAEGGWFAPVQDFFGDIAVLELDHPLDTEVEAEVAALGNAERSRDRTVLVHGHPNELHLGNWVRTTIIESIGTERVQLANAPGGIAPGFSGGGVLDQESGLVVGIVASSFTKDRRDAAYMIPMEVIARYWPRLAGLLDGDRTSEDLVDSASLARIADLLGERRSMLNPAGLSWVLEHLSDEVQGRLRTPTPSVSNLVSACPRISELRTLVDLVYYRDGTSAGRGPIDDLLATYGAPPRPSEEPAELGAETTQELYRLLLRQQHFLDRKTRELYLDAFASRVRSMRGLSIEVPLTDSAVDDAAKLVGECIRIPGVVRLLVDDFPYGDRNRVEFIDLLLFVEVLSPRRWLTDDERDRLLGLLRGVPDAILVEAHRRVAPIGELAMIDSVSVLVRHIEKYNQQPDEAPRLFTFVEHIAANFPQLRESLHHWSDLVAARMRQPRHHLDDLRMSIAHVASSVAPSPYVPLGMPVLMVQLAPDAQMPDRRYLLTVALENGSAGGGRFLVKAERPAQLPEIRDRLTELGADIADELGRRLDDLTIELVFPRSLITEPADQWVIPTLASEPIGARFQVYLRSYERVHRRQYWENWNQKWELVRRGNPRVGTVAHFVRPDEWPTPEQTRAALDDGKLLLICGRPPATQPRLQPADDFRAAIESGVPYVVWSRDPDRARELHAEFEVRMAGISVTELPERVSRWRSDEWFDSESPGLGPTLSLLACDHDRDMPPTSRALRAPGRMPS